LRRVDRRPVGDGEHALTAEEDAAGAEQSHVHGRIKLLRSVSVRAVVIASKVRFVCCFTFIVWQLLQSQLQDGWKFRGDTLLGSRELDVLNGSRNFYKVISSERAFEVESSHLIIFIAGSLCARWRKFATQV
jgi:hypothetical protein